MSTVDKNASKATAVKSKPAASLQGFPSFAEVLEHEEKIKEAKNKQVSNSATSSPKQDTGNAQEQIKPSVDQGNDLESDNLFAPLDDEALEEARKKKEEKDNPPTNTQEVTSQIKPRPPQPTDDSSDEEEPPKKDHKKSKNKKKKESSSSSDSDDSEYDEDDDVEDIIKSVEKRADRFKKESMDLEKDSIQVKDDDKVKVESFAPVIPPPNLLISIEEVMKNAYASDYRINPTELKQANQILKKMFYSNNIPKIPAVTKQYLQNQNNNALKGLPIAVKRAIVDFNDPFMYRLWGLDADQSVKLFTRVNPTNPPQFGEKYIKNYIHSADNVAFKALFSKNVNDIDIKIVGGIFKISRKDGSTDKETKKIETTLRDWGIYPQKKKGSKKDDQKQEMDKGDKDQLINYVLKRVNGAKKASMMALPSASTSTNNPEFSNAIGTFVMFRSVIPMFDQTSIIGKIEKTLSSSGLSYTSIRSNNLEKLSQGMFVMKGSGGEKFVNYSIYKMDIVVGLKNGYSKILMQDLKNFFNQEEVTAYSKQHNYSPLSFGCFDPQSKTFRSIIHYDSSKIKELKEKKITFESEELSYWKHAKKALASLRASATYEEFISKRFVKEAEQIEVHFSDEQICQIAADAISGSESAIAMWLHHKLSHALIISTDYGPVPKAMQTQVKQIKSLTSLKLINSLFLEAVGGPEKVIPYLIGQVDENGESVDQTQQ